MDNSTNLKEPMDAIRLALAQDKSEGSYYYSWQANIAMAFKDEFYRFQERNGRDVPITSEDIHQIANTAAKSFLDLLIGTSRQSSYKSFIDRLF